MPNAKKIAIVCYEYALEVAPVLSESALFLQAQGYEITMYVDRYYRDNSFSLPLIPIYNANIPRKRNGLIHSLIPIWKDRKGNFIRFLKQHSLERNDLIIVADFQSLELLQRYGYPLEKTVYFSLEGIDFLQRYDKSLGINLLSSCAFCLVQDQARAKTLEDYCASHFNFEFLPVSQRPRKIIRQKTNNAKIQMLYSGYFAPWACLLQVLHQYDKQHLNSIADLTLHGHNMGTDAYFKTVRLLANKIPGVTIDTNYYTGQAYDSFVQRYDLGLALYENLSNTGNFENLLFSSGKIASYLWNGLNVITNIKDKKTTTTPFIYLDSFNDNLMVKLQQWKSGSEKHKQKALQFAQDYYNLDTYWKTILSHQRLIFS